MRLWDWKAIAMCCGVLAMFGGSPESSAQSRLAKTIRVMKSSTMKSSTSSIQQAQHMKVSSASKRVTRELIRRAYGYLGMEESRRDNHGEPAQVFSNGMIVPWCANFIKTLFMEVGVRLPGRWTYLTNAQFMLTRIRQHLPFLWIGKYRPKPGDLAFFRERGSRTVNHVGIVVRVEKHRVFTIEGNYSNSVTMPRYGYDIQTGYVFPRARKRRLLGFVRWSLLYEKWKVSHADWKKWKVLRQKVLAYRWTRRALYQGLQEKRKRAEEAFLEQTRPERELWERITAEKKERIHRQSEEFRRRWKRLRRYVRNREIGRRAAIRMRSHRHRMYRGCRNRRCFRARLWRALRQEKTRSWRTLQAARRYWRKQRGVLWGSLSKRQRRAGIAWGKAKRVAKRSRREAQIAAKRWYQIQRKVAAEGLKQDRKAFSRFSHMIDGPSKWFGL